MAGHSFCPGCGFNTAEIGKHAEPPATARPETPVGPIWPDIDADPSIPEAAARGTGIPGGTPSAGSPSPPVLRIFERQPSATKIVIGAVVVAFALIVLSQLTRPGPGGAPTTPIGSAGQPQPGASAVGPGPALIVGLSIQNPADGQQVGTKEVTVIGLAPPGLGVTRDVSFGLDQHATADGTGHWAMSVGLNEGENKLKFRIGDDRSTEQTLRVIYTPPTP